MSCLHRFCDLRALDASLSVAACVVDVRGGGSGPGVGGQAGWVGGQHGVGGGRGSTNPEQ